jgi:three-Cys-motif partner protein
MRQAHVVRAQDDGLPTTLARKWALDKYALVGLYARLFSTGMKKKWPLRVYIDLYAGAGFSRIRGTNNIVHGSPLLALGVPDKFDKYIFCEQNPDSLDSLRQRVRRLYPAAEVEFISGDCNEKIEEICSHIPKESGVLSFCFLDPLDISIKFRTIRQLSNYRMDFLILLALSMDANRNEARYTDPRKHKIDEFLGLPDWRDRWKREQERGIDFIRFLAEQFSSQMEGLDYLRKPFHFMKQVRSDEKNLPLYHLALFSKHPLAFEYWQEVLKYSDDQLQMDYDS